MAKSSDRASQRECGIVMPISATLSHDAGHWSDVQTLIHRAVSLAGLQPRNVWVGSSTDRITPRIIASLFEVPIAVCDISDQNSNVMLELGMRLTSKKPTVVVAEKGSRMPFDIQDFEAVFYPGDLNILGMEKFFNELKVQLTDKLHALDNGSYEPFLKDITIDILEPEPKRVPFEDLVAGRLEAIMERLNDIETATAGTRTAPPPLKRVFDETRFNHGVLVDLSGTPFTAAFASEKLRESALYYSTILSEQLIIVPFQDRPNDATVEYVDKKLREYGINAKVTAQ